MIKMKKYEYMLIIAEHRRFYENGDIAAGAYKKAITEIAEEARRDAAISIDDFTDIYINALAGIHEYTWWKGEEK